MTLDKLLNRIKQRAGAFLGNDKDLKSLFHFISGFLFAEINSGISDPYGQIFWCEFRKFIVSETGHDSILWYEILESVYGSEAWDKFFEFIL